MFNLHKCSMVEGSIDIFVLFFASMCMCEYSGNTMIKREKIKYI